MKVLSKIGVYPKVRVFPSIFCGFPGDLCEFLSGSLGVSGSSVFDFLLKWEVSHKTPWSTEVGKR